jgi:hypothetical protein
METLGHSVLSLEGQMEAGGLRTGQEAGEKTPVPPAVAQERMSECSMLVGRRQVCV